MSTSDSDDIDFADPEMQAHLRSLLKGKMRRASGRKNARTSQIDHDVATDHAEAEGGEVPGPAARELQGEEEDQDEEEEDDDGQSSNNLAFADDSDRDEDGDLEDSDLSESAYDPEDGSIIPRNQRAISTKTVTAQCPMLIHEESKLTIVNCTEHRRQAHSTTAQRLLADDC